ncbi:MAG: GNAT family N-acetyltransferase, partial [Acidobacteria bacterium]|nr:GNAT family N-acetyltransferase [Acidobacteriota bacterium]
LFQALGLLHPRLRTAMLARELLNKRGVQVEVRIGTPVAAEKLLTLPDDEARTQYLRWRTYLLANRQDFKARTSRPLRRGKALEKAPVAAAVPAELLAADVASLNPLTRSGDLAAYLATAAELPHVLPEIGRLREITFRAAGEGAGKPLDLDRFDEHYLHLFVWNERKREIAGAYRLGQVDVVPELYTATLFKYDAALLDRLGPALELGRSFVRAEYQKSFSPLLLLWLGIGKFLARHPRYKVLFGPVSISNQYPTISRQLMVSFLERHATLDCWKDLVAARNPFRGPRAAHSGLDLEDLGDVVTDVDPARPGVPVLLRQYLKLGGKLLGFNLDPDFSDALDGLIVVDLTQTEPKWLDRYLGKEWRMSQACAESTDPQT